MRHITSWDGEKENSNGGTMKKLILLFLLLPSLVWGFEDSQYKLHNAGIGA